MGWPLLPLRFRLMKIWWSRSGAINSVSVQQVQLETYHSRNLR
jgi:hypothetical protein